MFYCGSIILFVSDPTQVGDITRIPYNAVPPNPTLKPVFRSAEMGEAEQLRERQ
jgi:hypothetical protein